MNPETTNQPLDEAAELIERCIEALGGRDSLYKVKSLYQQSERRFGWSEEDARTIRVDLYRAIGGRIRVEEFIESDRQILTVINGLSGIRRHGKLVEDKFVYDEPIELDVFEVERIKRGVRLYPRNFLAHADEHQYVSSGIQTIDDRKVYLIDLPVEEVSYHFDSETMLFWPKIDRRADSVTTYED